jgi:hypothetical protein
MKKGKEGRWQGGSWIRKVRFLSVCFLSRDARQSQNPLLTDTSDGMLHAFALQVHRMLPNMFSTKIAFEKDRLMVSAIPVA